MILQFIGDNDVCAALRKVSAIRAPSYELFVMPETPLSDNYAFVIFFAQAEIV